VATKAFTCGLDAALAVIGGKWKPLILFHLKNGPKRFAELRRLVAGVSEKVLIQHLRELASDRIITRRDYHEVPPKVDYEMTPFGLTLAHALGPLCAWGERNQALVEDIMLTRPKRLAPTTAPEPVSDEI
jgi:DNA-binding HxlR family transcriptional regulator